MKNFEKYEDEIIYVAKYEHEPFDCAIAILRGDKDRTKNCTKKCEICQRESLNWLFAEYVEPIKLTHDEYVILKNLDSKWKWIVRHDNGENLWLFVNKPTKEGYCIWVDLEEYDDEYFDMFNHIFQFIKWESEPYEIAKLIADYEKENGND